MGPPPANDIGVFYTKETSRLHFPGEDERLQDVEGDDVWGKEPKDEDAGKGKRAIWDTKCDYFMSMLGYAVGLGNIWRFPYLCYKNGGGAFLVPYFVMLFSVGIPLFFLEVSVSQFSSTGGLTIYSVCPALVGSGFASITTNIVVHSYYSLLLTYPLLFIFHSFTDTLPWGTCGNWWNTDNCYLVRERVTGMNETDMNATFAKENKHWVSPADEFFHRKILNITGGIDDIGDVVWDVLGTNIIVWVIGFLCIFKGIKVAGKVVWFTATFPILMLLVLLVRGLTLPGASNGLYYYLSPDFEKLKSGQVWAEAALQIFFSLGPGWSGVLTMGSYNKFRNNCIFDAFLIPIFNCSCSVIAGLVVFSVLGFMANEMGTTVDKVTAAGPALVFVTYPEALSMMPLAPFWSFLFFAMLFFVGLDSLFVSVEASIGSMLDRFSRFRKWRIWVTVAVVCCMFLMSFACNLQGGMYVLQLMDWYTSTLAIMSVCACEIFIFSYHYGIGRTLRDIEMMTGKHVNYYFYITLLFISPLMLFLAFLNQVLNLAPVSYRDVVFPLWAQAIGWNLAVIPVAMIPAYFVYFLCKTPGSLKERIIAGFTPSISWGPLSAVRRAQWEEYCRSRPLRHKLLHPDFKPKAPTPNPMSSPRI